MNHKQKTTASDTICYKLVVNSPCLLPALLLVNKRKHLISIEAAKVSSRGFKSSQFTPLMLIWKGLQDVDYSKCLISHSPLSPYCHIVFIVQEHEIHKDVRA